MNIHNARPFFLLLLAVGILLLLGYVLPESIAGYEIKPVTMLSDICVSDSDSINAAQIAELKKREAAKDSCPPGIFPVQDFSKGQSNGMHHFYEALYDRERLGRPVRIAYFGDSFIEGDIYTADLRSALQDKYGGNGVGLVDMKSPFAGFRNSVTEQSGGWDLRTVLMSGKCDYSRLGPSQRYCMPMGGAYSIFKGGNVYKHTDKFETALLYIRSNSPVNVKATVNGDSVFNYTTLGDGSIETLRCEEKMNSIRWDVSGGASVTCFGTSLEGRKGIVLDNFSLRGSSGITLSQIPQQQWNDLAQARPYDLIILHFGLNVASTNAKNYDYYYKGMTKTINMLKEAYPEAGIMIVSISDREGKIKGELHTLPGVINLITYQERIASDCNISFWNLYDAMGGEGSIVEMTKAKPKQARKDYTHVTREGGTALSKIFVKSLIYSYEKYIKQTK